MSIEQAAIAFAYSVRFRRCSALSGRRARPPRRRAALEPAIGRRALVGLRRAGTASARHEAADRGLEDLGLVRDRLRGHAIERDLGREVIAVVTIGAVLAEQRPLLLGARLPVVNAEPADAGAERGHGDDSAGDDGRPPHQMTPPSSRRCANPPL
jgi:hypothetical protein